MPTQSLLVLIRDRQAILRSYQTKIILAAVFAAALSIVFKRYAVHGQTHSPFIIFMLLAYAGVLALGVWAFVDLGRLALDTHLRNGALASGNDSVPSLLDAMFLSPLGPPDNWMNQWILADLSLHLDGGAIHEETLSGTQRKVLYAVLLSAGPIGKKMFTLSGARRLLAVCASFHDPSPTPFLLHISGGRGLARLYPELQGLAQDLIAQSECSNPD